MGDFQILLTGATGFIGGTVLTALLANYPASSITVLSRASSSIDVLKPLQKKGLKVIVCQTLDDAGQEAEVAYVARDFDVVIHEASADNLPWVKGIISGLEERAKAIGSRGFAGGRRPLFMYGGGTGNITDDSRGELRQEKPYSDIEDLDRWERLTSGSFHRQGDLLTVAATKRGIIDVAHMAPGLVYGTGTGPGKTISDQVPAVIKLAVERGRAAYISKGVGVWSPVHVKDVAEAFIVLIKHWSGASFRSSAASGWESLHTIDTPEILSWREITTIVGDSLASLGRIKKGGAESIPFDTERWKECTIISANARTSGDRLRRLGWEARQPSLKKSIKGDVEQWLQERG